MTIKRVSVDFKFDYAKFRNDIIAFCDAHNLSLGELDQLAGIGQGNASNVVNNRLNQKMNTWLALANAMDIDVRTYFYLD